MLHASSCRACQYETTQIQNNPLANDIELLYLQSMKDQSEWFALSIRNVRSGISSWNLAIASILKH